jgi:hypothetical protein
MFFLLSRSTLILYLNNFLIFILQLIALSERFSTLKKLNSTSSLQPLLWLLKKILITFSLSYALLGFGLLEWNIYMKVKLLLQLVFERNSSTSFGFRVKLYISNTVKSVCKGQSREPENVAL